MKLSEGFMESIVRGIPIDARTKIGFCGSPSQALQQRMSDIEGVVLSQRWEANAEMDIESPNVQAKGLRAFAQSRLSVGLGWFCLLEKA